MRRWSVVRSVAAAVGPVLVAAGLSAPPAYASQPTGGMSAPALNTLFNQFGDTSGRWIGADGAASVPLPDGRAVWLFSNTLIGAVNPDHTISPSTPMIDNSAVVQDGTSLVATLHGGTAQAPASLVPTGVSDEFFGVGDATVEGSALRVLYRRMKRVGEGGLDFQLTGTALATFALPGLTLTSVVSLPVGDTIGWGSAILEDGTYTYIYGSEFAADGLQFAHVARVPVGGLSGAWEFWNGSSWSTSESTSARLISGVGVSFGVQKIGGQYVAVSVEGQLPFDSAVVAFTASAPTGPFGEPKRLFVAPEPGTYDGKSLFVYDARFHPELARPGKLLVSYSVNSHSVDPIYADASVYRPRFVEVDWPVPQLDPATLPASPTGLTATTPVVGEVHLSWQAPAGLNFAVYRRDVTAGHTHYARLPSVVTENSIDFSDVSTGHTYAFKVAAINAVGEGLPSAAASATVTVPPPLAPTGLTAAAQPNGSITLTWTAVAGAWRYEAYRRDVTAGETTFVRVDPTPNVASFSATGLEHQHEYEFYVVAVHGGGSSPGSATVRATAMYTPAVAPTGVAAAAQPDGTIRLSWTASSTPEAWYVAYQRDVTAGETTATQLPLPVTVCCTMTAGYLHSGHQYEYQVSALNRGGESGRSNATSAVALNPPPAPPTGLTGAAQNGQVALSWTASVTPDVWYLVYLRDVTAGDTAFTKLPLPVTVCCTMTAGYLVNGHAYEFKVSSFNSNGESAPSNVVTVTPVGSTPPPPTGLTATAQPDGGIRLSWTASAPDLWYVVYQRDVTAGESAFTRLQLPVTICCTMTAGYLVNGHVYEFKVSSFNSNGESAPSNSASARSAAPLPPAPTGLTATAQADGTIRLAWTAPAPDLWYMVHMRDATVNGSWESLPIPVSTCCTFIAGQLTDNHVYQFMVAGLNTDALEGPTSNIAQATAQIPAPAPPTGLTGTAGNGQAALSWIPSTTPSVWYVVYLRDVTAGETAFTKLPLPVTVCCTMTAGYLVNGHRYDFKVTAYNSGGESLPSNVISVTPVSPLPGAPTGLSATAQAHGTVRLTWTAPAPDLWYVVHQRDATTNGAWQTLPLPVTTCCTFTAGPLTHNHVYQFKVGALNTTGVEGPTSGIAQTTARYALPAAPTNLRGSSNGDGSVSLAWDAPGPNLLYWVYKRDVSAGERGFTRSATPIDRTYATWDWLVHGHVYEFKTTATNPAGEGPASNTIRVTSYGGRPVAPSGLSASAGNGQVTLRWTGVSTPHVWYVIYQRDVTSGQSWQRLPLPITTCCTFTAGYLANGHTYEFKVAATNWAGESGPSNVVSARPLPPFPVAPSGLSATAGDNRVTLRWTGSPTPGVWYWIEYRPSGGTWRRLPYPYASCCTFTVTFLANGTTYDFQLRATNEAGTSGPSNIASARPMPPVPAAPTGLTAVQAGPYKARLTWNPVAGADGYYIYHGVTKAVYEFPVMKRLPYPVTGTSFTVDYLFEPGLHWFTVAASDYPRIGPQSGYARMSPLLENPNYTDARAKYFDGSPSSGDRKLVMPAYRAGADGGIVVARAFIAQGAYEAISDHRGYNAHPLASARIHFAWDTGRGLVGAYAQRSCSAVCTTALPLAGYASTANDYSSVNYNYVWFSGSGDTMTGYWKASNSQTNNFWPLTAHIDARISFRRSSGARFSASLLADHFPTYEVYQYPRYTTNGYPVVYTLVRCQQYNINGLYDTSLSQRYC